MFYSAEGARPAHNAAYCPHPAVRFVGGCPLRPYLRSHISGLGPRPNPLQIKHPQPQLPHPATFIRGPFALFEIDQCEAASADYALGAGIAGLDVLCWVWHRQRLSAL
jgi:hypothetical protein